MNPSAPGLSFHKLDKAKNRRFWKAVRVLRLFPENRISEVVHQARHVLVVLLTDVLGELAVRAPDVVPTDRPRSGVCPRIVNRRFVVQRVLVRSRVLLDHVEHIGVRMADGIEPASFVEADDVDHEGVAVPVTDRMPEKRRVQRVAFGMRAPIQVDLAPDVGPALEDHDDALLLWELKDLHRIGSPHQPRPAWRQAVSFRVVFRLVLEVVVVDRRRPRHERDPGLRMGAADLRAGTAIHRSTNLMAHDLIAEIEDDPDVPDSLFAGRASQVRRPIGQARRRLRRSSRPPGDIGRTATLTAWRRRLGLCARRDVPQRHKNDRARDDQQRTDQAASHCEISVLRARKRIRCALWASRRPPGKARGARIPGVCKRRATKPGGMHRRPEGIPYSFAGPYSALQIYRRNFSTTEDTEDRRFKSEKVHSLCVLRGGEFDSATCSTPVIARPALVPSRNSRRETSLIEPDSYSSSARGRRDRRRGVSAPLSPSAASRAGQSRSTRRTSRGTTALPPYRAAAWARGRDRA